MKYGLLDAIKRRLLKGKLITTRIIQCEYARTHEPFEHDLSKVPQIKAEDFPVEDLKLSLDDFSRKLGWIK